ncbi:MAG: hypothetical protein ACXAEU_25895 [Candidatus Hodarchaeales archaeon]
MVLVDNIGSLPLPMDITQDQVSKAAVLYARSLAKGLAPQKIALNKFINRNLVLPVQQAFELTLTTGVDLPNYPQLRGMNDMFLILVEDDLTIKKELAVIPEVVIIDEWAATRSEKINLRVCITGAIELAIAKYGTLGLNSLMIDRLCDAVTAFQENLFNSCNNINIKLVSIDEPSIGLRDFPPLITDEYMSSALDREMKAIPENVPINIHLHSLARLEPVLATRRVDYIGAEFAADPSNYMMLDKETLKRTGKKIRAGIANTSLDSLVLKHAEEKGLDPGSLFNNQEKLEAVLEPENVMISRLENVIKKFGKEMVPIAGPDCGLKSWKYQELAREVLTRVVTAVKGYQ